MHEVGGGAGGGEAGPLPGGQASQPGVGGAAGQVSGQVGRRCVSGFHS